MKRVTSQKLGTWCSHKRKRSVWGTTAKATIEHHLVGDEFDADLLAVDDALRELAGVEPRVVQVIECRFFGGLSVEETAEALRISVRTVKRDWILAKSWLYQKLRAERSEEPR